MNDKKLILKWADIVRRKKKWNSCEFWSNHEYNLLSQDISKKTNSDVSRNTIRNLIQSITNQDAHYQPHSATLLTLGQYLGYSGWEAFVKHQIKIRKQKFYFGVLFSLAVIVLSLFYIFQQEALINQNFKFRVLQSNGSAPHTVSIDYDLSHFKKNNIAIDYGHFGPNGIYLSNNITSDTGTIQQCFHFPGIYRIRLLVDNKVLHREQIHIYSDNWFIYASDAILHAEKLPEIIENSRPFIPQPILFENILKEEYTSDGILHISTKTINKLSRISANYNTNFIYVDTFNVDIRNTDFIIEFKNTSLGEGLQCNEATFILFGQKGRIAFKFAEDGCNNYCMYRIGEKVKRGKYNTDLDFLKLNFKNYNNIQLLNSKDSVSININGFKRFAVRDTQDLGKLVGLNFIFKGSPIIKNASIKAIDLDSKFEEFILLKDLKQPE